ncbi:homocysteine methyltransferase [Knoellia sinensis KCTC 19936]|uniref:Homocysteine methyltransferase n=1 Tax=Knoellia sinensis KCTC 19936 TaxID=1385520 RepID=A0A0A0JCY8_9MICO|nr:homocysteine S-methyltransferase family protein [Knoellia sinensis]KGN34669.1 homocysteine methyltransferase [Knoellia sinensis KCTC 19936]
MSDVRAQQRPEGASDAGPRWVTDGGLETDLIFHHGVDLPGFAAYPLLDSVDGRALLTDYYAGYARVSELAGANLLLETPTWRANPDWVVSLGGSPADVRRINLDSIVYLAGVAEMLAPSGRVLVSGSIGPRGDGYLASERGTAEEFADYHSSQIGAFAEGGADRVTAYTLTTVAEAVGVVLAARAQGVDVGVSFTVETDGTLPDGTPLGVAVDALWGQAAPDGFLVNCAHPHHIAEALSDDSWTTRVTGLRVNASRQSHAELDAAEVLDEGDLPDLVSEHERLARQLPNLDVVGGCCGTDARHVAALWGLAT